MKNMKRLKVVLLAALCLLLIPNPVWAAKVDGPNGYFFKATANSLQYQDAGFQLQLAPDTLRDNTKVSVQKLETSPLQGSSSFYVSKAVDINLVGDKFGMQSNFIQPMRVIFSFDMTDYRRASNLDTSQPVGKFRIGYYDKTIQDWTEIASRVFWDGANGQVEAGAVQGAGRYALLWAKNDSASLSTPGGDQIRLFLNYNLISSAVPPYIKNGRTMVPLGIIAENLGTQVLWTASTQLIEIKANTTSIKLNVGSTTADKNGTAMTMEVAPEIQNGRTFVPLGFVVKALNAEANWDGVSHSIYILK